MTQIMNTYNGHNKVLVEKINAAWNDDRMQSNFGLIVYAIAKRDECEIENREGFGWNDFADFLSLIIDAVDKDAISWMLENVCDDQDLENILQFVGFDRWY